MCIIIRKETGEKKPEEIPVKNELKIHIEEVLDDLYDELESWESLYDDEDDDYSKGYVIGNIRALKLAIIHIEGRNIKIKENEEK